MTQKTKTKLQRWTGTCPVEIVGEYPDWELQYYIPQEDREMDKCPFCDAARTIEPNTHYDCGQPIKPVGNIYRPGLCYERQLEEQRKLLKQCRDATKKLYAKIERALKKGL